MDPVAYMEHNRIPNLFAKEFIGEVAKFGNANLDMVMDIGCGPGNISTYWIDHYYPDIKRLVGIDVDPGMIALAKEQNKKEKVEYHVADIMKKDTLKEWEGRVGRIYSNFMLHRVTNQKQAFKNIFDLLEPTGQAALSFIVESPYYFAFMDLLKSEKWGPILKPTNFVFPESFVNAGYTTAHYERMFKEVGFHVLYCERKAWEFPYESDEECINLLYSLHTIGDLTDRTIEDYKRDMFDQYMKYSLRDDNGFPVHNLIVLHAMLRKDVTDDQQA